MKKIFLILLVILVIPAVVFSQDQKKAIYFYNDNCSHCFKVDQYFTDNGIYDKYEIKKIETSGFYNLDYLNRFFDAFGVKAENRGWPVIFFDAEMLIGDQPIIKEFVEKIETTNASDFPDPEKVKEALLQKGAPVENNSGFAVSIPILISAALVDAINPCAFAVLIILLATVINAKGKRQALFSGLLFTLAIFISYLLMGFGVYKAVSAFNLPQKVSLAVGILAIVIGLANLKDAFWHGKAFLMEVPMSWRPKMKEILSHVASPFGAFVSGLIVSIFLLPCTSGPYIVVLGLMAKKDNLAETIPLLILYNLIFVLPMLIITAGMYFGVRMKRLEEWRQKNIRLLHAIAGVIMLILGGYLIWGWI